MKKPLLWSSLKIAIFLLLLGAALLRMQSLRRDVLQFSAARRFQGDTEYTYVQISGYWEAGQTASSMEEAKQAVEAELEQALGAQAPMRMAWGSQTAATAVAASHSSSVELYRVSEDFFSIYPFLQLAGSYQYLDDAAAVLNEQAAWELFASTDCVGCRFSLDGADYTVQGVCETPGSGSQIYLSEPDGEITFCELLLPERWSGFAEGLVEAVQELNGGVVYCNTGRDHAAALWSAAQSSLKGTDVPFSLPVWERSAETAVLRLQILAAASVLLSLHLAAFAGALLIRFARVPRRNASAKPDAVAERPMDAGANEPGP